MSRLTRRDLLKTALAASAGAVAANALRPAAQARIKAAPSELFPAPPRRIDDPISSPRERLLLDFDWRFQLGHANDPARDFGLGARRRELQFAKSGNFLPVTRSNFDDSGWRKIDLPHDWAAELPFKEAPVLPNHYLHQSTGPDRES